MNKFISDKSDLHIHTVASDGELFPIQIIEMALNQGLKTISITDHDSIKTYKDIKNNFINIAKNKGLELISGIEMDSMYKSIEVHILGYDIDINNKELNEYLKSVSDLRKKRIIEQIDEINNKMSKEILKTEDIIREERDTYMKPHLINSLLKTPEFNSFTYRKIMKWIKENIKIKTNVDKPDSGEVVRMIKASGGTAYLAHPGFYIYYNSLILDDLIIELKEAGLDGLEYIYPYSGSGSEISFKKEKEIIELIRLSAEKHKLLLSRGSDAHEKQRFIYFN